MRLPICMLTYKMYLSKERAADRLKSRLNITDDFRTIDWTKEYPAPEFTIKQIQELLAA